MEELESPKDPQRTRRGQAHQDTAEMAPFSSGSNNVRKTWHKVFLGPWNSKPQLVRLLGTLWNVTSCGNKVRVRHTLTKPCWSNHHGEDSSWDLLPSQQLRDLLLSTCMLKFTTMTFASSKEVVATRWRDRLEWRLSDGPARPQQTVRICWESLPLVKDVRRGHRRYWFQIRPEKDLKNWSLPGFWTIHLHQLSHRKPLNIHKRVTCPEGSCWVTANSLY